MRACPTPGVSAFIKRRRPASALPRSPGVRSMTSRLFYRDLRLCRPDVGKGLPFRKPTPYFLIGEGCAFPYLRPILSMDSRLRGNDVFGDGQAEVVFIDEDCEDSVEAQPRRTYGCAKLRKGKPFRKSARQSRTLPTGHKCRNSRGKPCPTYPRANGPPEGDGKPSPYPSAATRPGCCLRLWLRPARSRRRRLCLPLHAYPMCPARSSHARCGWCRKLYGRGA